MKISNILIIVTAIIMYVGIYAVAAHFLLKKSMNTLTDSTHPTPHITNVIDSIKIETDTGAVAVDMPEEDTILDDSDITTDLTEQLLVNEDVLPKEYQSDDLTAKSPTPQMTNKDKELAKKNKEDLMKVIEDGIKNSPFKGMYCSQICQIYKDSIMAAHSFPHNDPYFVACKTGQTFKKVFDEIQKHDLILD